MIYFKHCVIFIYKIIIGLVNIRLWEITKQCKPNDHLSYLVYVCK